MLSKSLFMISCNSTDKLGSRRQFLKMIKRKLHQQVAKISKITIEANEGPAACLRKLENKNENITTEGVVKPLTSNYFPKPLWKEFYDLACDLNKSLEELNKPTYITHIYNPIVYASELHCEYLRKFLNGQKRLVFIGMNPGPNGMGQNGIPFGNTSTVRDLMKLSGSVQQPPAVHPKRPVSGLSCSIEEPSGVRIWTLFKNISGSLDTFSQQCFVHNFCPLAFFDAKGANLTPSELKGDYKKAIRDLCTRTLEKQILLLNPEIVVAVGAYVYDCLKQSSFYHSTSLRCLKIPHPSPRAVNNSNWTEEAESFLRKNDLFKYLKNEA